MTNLILGFIFLIILTGCSQSELDAQSYEPDYSQGMAVYDRANPF